MAPTLDCPAAPSLDNGSGHGRTRNVLRVLYLYAGIERKASMGAAILELIMQHEHLELDEVDILRGGKEHDMLSNTITDEFGRRIDLGEFDVVLASPPCCTFTRVQFANRRGPLPVRSRQYPRGLPTLVGTQKAKADHGNQHAATTADLLRRQAQAGGHGLLEQPEDLGTCKLGSPASMWQLEEIIALGEVGYERGAILVRGGDGSLCQANRAAAHLRQRPASRLLSWVACLSDTARGRRSEDMAVQRTAPSTPAVATRWILPRARPRRSWI
jgi:hypothetical protein